VRIRKHACQRAHLRVTLVQQCVLLAHASVDRIQRQLVRGLRTGYCILHRCLYGFLHLCSVCDRRHRCERVLCASWLLPERYCRLRLRLVLQDQLLELNGMGATAGHKEKRQSVWGAQAIRPNAPAPSREAGQLPHIPAR
jgi:hypothetical protein